jgi:molybdate transport system substrate-binding protein
VSRRAAPAAALVAGALVLAACGPAREDAQGAQGRAEELSGEVVVFAAASLTDTFTELGELFEDQHPQVTVELGFGGSSGLAEQVLAGAPADVLATASPATMRTVVDAGAVDGEPAVFVRNVLQLVVPAGNPAGVTGLDDLSDAELAVALCAPQVPCGAAAQQLLDAAGVVAQPDTLEQDVRAVLTKVELGEVDAALVYRTDVLAAGEAVEGIDVPRAGAAVNDYPVAVLAGSPNPAAARAFVDLVLSPDGQDVLSGAGFELP